MAIHNPNRKKVLGHGIITNYIDQGHTNITKEKAYRYWMNILYRCFNSEYIKEHPLCKDTTVCTEWLDYANFKKWYDKNYYNIDKQKMILVSDLYGSKKFCPETSFFLPDAINRVFQTYSKKVAGSDLPKGITIKPYQAYGVQIYVYTVAIQAKYIGIYSDRKEAMQVWQGAKQNQLDALITKYEAEIPQNVIDILRNYKFEIKD